MWRHRAHHRTTPVKREAVIAGLASEGLALILGSVETGSSAVCVCYFVLLNRYWGIVTVPGSIPYGSTPGVSGSSPSTLTTSLTIPVPSSSSSNGPRNYSVDNHGLVPWRLRRLGRSKVRSASLVRVLSDENDSSGTGSQGLSNRAPPTT